MAFSFRVPAFAACTLLLAACAGGHGPGAFTPAAVPQSDAAFEPAGAQTVPMKYSIKIPAAKPAVTEAQRHEQFVSASTQSIVFQVYKPGKTHNAKNLISTTVVALNAGAKGCTSAKTRICSGTLNLPPPSVDLVATTYDKKPAGKKIPKNAKALGAATVSKLLVKANKKVAFTLGGIPASFTMTIPGSTVVNGVQSATMIGMYSGDTNIAIAAYDADDNLIVTDGYVNAAGKSTGVAMSEKPSQKTCSEPVLQEDENTAGTSIVVNAPPKSGVFFNYGSNGIAQAFSTPGYCSFAITARLVGDDSVQRGRFVLSGPLLTEYSIGSSLATPDAITVGPDNNIWFTDLAGNVGTINVSTKAVTEYALGNADGIVSQGGSLWVTAFNTLVRVQTNGSMTSFPMTNTGNPGEQLAVDSSGNFWFAETQSQKVAKVTPTGATTEFPVAGTTYPVGVTAGADGNMWFTGCIGNIIGRIAPSVPNKQTIYNVPDISPNNVTDPFMMVAGSDGNLWFTSCAGGIIGYTALPTGTIIKPTYFQAPVIAPITRGQIYGIAPGTSSDMWAADIADNTLDRIPLGATSASQITTVRVSESPFWPVAGPDGAIWFSERTRSNTAPPNGKIGRIQP